MLPEDDRSLTLNMKFSTLFSAALLSVVVGSGSADAALVSFLGSVDTGSPVVLGSLPRNFKLTLDYTPSPGGVDTAVTGTLTFPSTPNGKYFQSGCESRGLGRHDWNDPGSKRFWSRCRGHFWV